MTKTSYDPLADALYARFAADNVEISDTREVGPGVMIDLDETGNLVGIEVLGVNMQAQGEYASTSALAS